MAFGVKFPSVECARLSLKSVLHSLILWRASAINWNHEALRNSCLTWLLIASM
jgi:hypothetical protein